MSEPLVQCRPRSNLILIPDILTAFNVVLDPQDNLPVIGFFIETKRHIAKCGFESPLCPGNKDGLVAVIAKSKNVKSAVVTCVRPDLIETKVTPVDRAQPLSVFLRLKFQEDKVKTNRDNPRRTTVQVWFTLPPNGNPISPSVKSVAE